MIIVNKIRMLLLAAWLGVAIYFSVVVAPSAFGVLRSFELANASEVAGTIVTRTLSVVNISGAVVGLLLLLTVFGVRKYSGKASFIVENVLLALMVVATIMGQWVIAPKMVALRVAMGGQIDRVPLSDSARMAFATLHQYSVVALSVAMLAALAALVLMLFTRERVVEASR